MKTILVSFILMTSLISNAKVFRNAYISFELPESWNCHLEQTEWVCRSEMSKESKEAIIILTAKEVGPTDSYGLYQSHLDGPITTTTKGGGNSISKVMYKSKFDTINDQKWVDGLHLGSEVQNYYTRYMATVKDKIAILVTFSAHKNYYTKYTQDFVKAISSLRVIAAASLTAKPDLSMVRPATGEFGTGIQQAMPMDMFQDSGPGADGGKSSGKKKLILLGAFLLLALGGYMVMKNKKRK